MTGRHLRLLRQLCGLTLAEMALLTGISDTHLSAVELGRRTLHDGLLALVVDAIRVRDSAASAA